MPQLKIQTGAQKGQSFLIAPPGPYSFGRDLEADFPLFDRRVSRSHFRIEFRDEGYRLTDLGSRAGTTVNDERVRSVVLEPGSRILAGTTTLIFEHDRPEDPMLGRELGGYRILECVGRGGMGLVYRALQLSLQRVVALKVLPEEVARDAEFSRLFVAEARAAAELSHPHIVRVYDVNALGGILFYAMEFMAQGSVEDLCRRRGLLPVAHAIRIAVDTARGLEFAEHHGYVHRDIKPSNLMLHESGAVKIGDLGIATRLREKGGKRLRGITGSPHYMPPEQALGRDLDVRADIYALGATIHRMVTGSPPFRGETVKELLFAHLRTDPPDLRQARPEAPASLSLLVRSMLAKDPAARPAGPSALIALLEAAAEDIDPDLPGPARSRPWVRRALFIPSVALVLLLGIGTGVFVRHLGTAVRERNDRIEDVQDIIGQGMRHLQAGDIEGAVRSNEALSRVRGSPEDWDLLRPKIAEFEWALRNALKAREGKGGE